MHIHPRRVLAAFTLAAALATVGTFAQSGAVTVGIDVAQSRRAINPNVYGVAYATPAQLADLNAPLNRYGGNNTTPLQLADQRRQSRAGLVLPEHPGNQRHRRQARRRLHHRCQKRRRAASTDHSDHRLGGAAGRQPREAGQLLDRQVRPADRQRLRSGFPMQATASAPATAPGSPGTTRPMPTRRTTRRCNAAGSTTSSRAGAWPPTAG